MSFTIRSSGRLLRVALLATVFTATCGMAQDYSSMGISAVVGSADSMLRSGDYRGAINALEEVLRRMGDGSPATLTTVQTCRFQLGRAYYLTDDPDSGVEILEKYLENEPRGQERTALRLMAQGFFDSGEWEKIEAVAQRLLNMPDLEKEDVYNGNLLLGQALFRQEKWADSVAPLSYASDHTKDERTRGRTRIMMVRALVESENWEDLFSLIPVLYRTDAKYDITLNLTLMKAGKARYEEAGRTNNKKDYLNALLLYRMVLPREELLEFSSNKVNALAKKLAADVRIGIKKADQESRRLAIDDLRESMAILDDLPAYEDEVTFRIGQIYAEVKRYWEGYVLFNKLYQQDRNNDIGEASMLQSVLILYDVAEIPRAEERILQYVNEKPDGQYARTMLSMMIRDNLIKQEVSDVIGLRDHIEGMPSTQEQDELMLQADLHYMLAFGYFQDREFALATEQFERIRDKKYSNSSNYSDALFYHGMGEMMQGKYQEAMDDFVSYRNKYKSGEHLPASMFREAVCFFGLGDTIQSEAVFTQFIGTYSDHALVSEAYSMRGDIEGAKDGNDDPSTPDVNEYDPHTLDRALADYRKGIDTASTELQASYPAFQAAKVFKLEFKWQEIIDLMNYYMNKWDDKADVAQAVYWIGQSQIEMDQVPEAITAYLDAIERFGNEVSQEGVDKIIVELVNIADQYLYEEDRAALVTKVKLKLSALDERLEVLKIRLQVALAQLEGEAAVAQLGAELLQSAANLDKTTPVSLAIMCDAAVAASDAAQMDRLFDYFVSMYEEADLLWHAYRAQVNSLLVSQDPQAVLDAIEEAQGLFGADAYMAWAQISKAQTLFDMRKYVEAEEAYNMIMGVAEWRGRVFAEAMYGMGQCRVARRDFETAHSFFQRTYLLFKGYDEGKWALMGYMAAADCLVQLGRDADAVNTWNALLEDEYVNELPAAEEARDMLKKYGGA